MAKFCKNFVEEGKEITAPVAHAPAPVEGMVMRIFDKYDINNSGYLEKKEVLGLLNDLLTDKGE
jgi:hypothetical protein